APIPTFPRKRGKGPVHGEKIQTAPPPPLAGEGRGGGRFRSPRSKVSRRTLPPSRPSPASWGRERVTARRLRPPPLLPAPGAGPLQVAALNGPASDIAPIPTFPRERGKGPVHGEKIQTAPPPPACGGGPGRGPLQIAALNGVASDIAPIPTFPRKRGKELGSRGIIGR